MKLFQVTFALLIAAVLESSSAISFEWRPEADVEIPANILAPSYSGSGSTMFFDGSVGADDERKSAGSGSATDEASAATSERNFGLLTVLTAVTTMLVLTTM
ncbi:hypothetical protein G195_006493 [Phytophthora kernoviae 00238/432]|uniref:RxLR effector protein n=1 Tax=Phytophthora kernoviae 00238/432 TaxID=1284355 RepID=A0A8J4SFU1_9STRA|nr:hypothetical protein G195_006493 [Phytophthora kernoviae 00238/432]